MPALFDTLPNYWQNELSDLKPKFRIIEDTLTLEANNGIQILPDKRLVFRALQVTPEDASVVIVGQDPYPNPNHACGLSFSIPPATYPVAGSLRNILKEIQDDTGRKSIVKDGDLTPWVKQGVVLLNRVLTVQNKLSGAHYNIGWQEITDRIIKKYSDNTVGLLWGGAAKDVRRLFNERQVICGVHPSPLSAHKGFFGSKPFSKVNQILVSMGKKEIIW